MQCAEIWASAAGLLRLLCVVSTPPPDQLQRPTPTSLLSAQPKAHCLAPCRGCQAAASGYRYRPASDHVTMWRDSTKLECRADPGSE